MIKIDYETTASFDVDAQNGFTPLCPLELPVTDGENIVDELNAMAKLVKYRLGSKDSHCPQAVHTATPEAPQFTPVVGEPNVNLKWNMHCVMGTYGAELLKGLPHWSKYNFFVWKGMEPDTHPYGALYHDAADTISTGAKEYLRAVGVNTVIVGGLATDFCVFKTVTSLVEAGFKVILNLGGCRAIDANGSLEAAMNEMKRIGVVFANNSKELEN